MDGTKLTVFGPARTSNVPLDPKAPARRAAFIMNDCSVNGLITPSGNLAELKPFLKDNKTLQEILLTDNPDNIDQGDLKAKIQHWDQLAKIDEQIPLPVDYLETDPAYLLYTSGSTGEPKGVILSHRHALTFVDWGVKTFEVGPEDRVSNHAPLHFDLSIFDIFSAMQAGAVVVLVPDQLRLFPMEQAKWIEEQKITVWYSVPSALIRILLHGKMDRFSYKNLRAVLYAGEPFPVKHLRKVMENMKHTSFHNLYGPAETNVCTYYALPNKLNENVKDVPIGKACANSEVFALNEQGQIIKRGEVGEMVVKGPTVMFGYWNLPERTKKSLVTNPFQTAYEEKIFKTGDLVRLEEDGNYTFIGRKDHMVKSRGYRIELGEIEQVIYQYDEIKEIVVLAIPDEEVGNRIAAVIVTNSQNGLSASDLQSYCVERLPFYMVPETYIFKDELPRTSTGKADRVNLAKSISFENKEGAE